MQTRTEVIAARLTHYITDTYANARRKEIAVGERPTKAGQLLEAGKVRRLGPELYEVGSGEKKGTVYKVNGLCACPDGRADAQGVSKAPGGWCKHRLAGRYFDLIERDLRLLRESRIPHAHRYVCAEHTIPEIDCWEQSCTDPVEIPCPICAKTRSVASSQSPGPDPGDTAEVDAVTGEMIEDAEVPYPVIASASTGDTTETPFPEEDDTMMSTLGETVTQVIERLRGSRNGCAPEPVVIDTTPEVEAEPAPLIYKPEQYEPAPVIEAEEVVPFLPEAPASLNLKFKMAGTHELMYTMRAHTDEELMERLPKLLAALEKVLDAGSQEIGWFRRITQAVLPRHMRGERDTYQGK